MSIERPKVIEHDKVKYYNAADLKKYDPTYFFGTSGGVRYIITRKKITTSDYRYATFSKRRGWASSNKKATKAKLLLRESWVITNVPKMMPDSAESKESKYEYPEAPELLHLADNEKFKDDKGTMVDIETRGTRTHKGIYFSAKDVSEAFGMPSLSKDIYEKTNIGYINGVHFKTFISRKVQTTGSPVSKKQLFITYKGMLKILFSSRTGNADKFVDWATETLFIAQMGTQEQKEKLCADIIGQPIKNIRAVFKTSSKKMPCIYMFFLGAAKMLRESMNLSASIKDDFIIVKFGLTDDLDRRSGEHMRTYGNIPNVNMGLMTFSYIAPQFLQQAENDIKSFFKSFVEFVDYNNHTEIVAIAPINEKQVKEQYELIATKYQGHAAELIEQIKDLKHTIELKNVGLEKKDKDVEVKDVELKCIIEVKNAELKCKNLELENLRLKNENLRLKLNQK